MDRLFLFGFVLISRQRGTPLPAGIMGFRRTYQPIGRWSAQASRSRRSPSSPPAPLPAVQRWLGQGLESTVRIWIRACVVDLGPHVQRKSVVPLLGFPHVPLESLADFFHTASGLFRGGFALGSILGCTARFPVSGNGSGKLRWSFPDPRPSGIEP